MPCHSAEAFARKKAVRKVNDTAKQHKFQERKSAAQTLTVKPIKGCTKQNCTEDTRLKEVGILGLGF